MRFRGIGFDGIRGYGAMLVVFSHTASFLMVDGLVVDGAIVTDVAGPGLSLVSLVAALGIHGLTAFFVISGFLLYRPFAMQMAAGSRTLILREYMRNRLLRIFPAYLVVFVLCAFVIGAVITEAPDGNGDAPIGRMTDPFLIITNATLTHGYFPEGQLTGLSASWSLVPEFAYYLLLPPAWFLGRRLSRTMRWQLAALVPVAMLMLTGLVTRFAITIHLLLSDSELDLLSSATWEAVVWRSILTQGDLIAFGMALAVASVHWSAIRDDEARERSRTRLTRLAGWLIVVGAVLALPAKLFGVDVVPVGVVVCGVIWLVNYSEGRVARLFTRILTWKPIARVGVVSFSMYLWHESVIFFVETHFESFRYDGVVDFIPVYAAIVLVSYLLGEITYRLVEEPMLNRKRSMIRRDENPVATP